jgi:flagellar basal-body rod protein FlgG
MIQGISASTTGLNASQTLLDVTSNNLANLNTTGFKTSQVGFQDLFYATLSGVGTAGGPGASAAVPTQVGLGVRVSSTAKSFAQGPLQNTGNPLDVAIEGNGFFQVTRPDGTTAFTRDGTFRVDANGQLVTADGSLVQPAITFPPGTTSITIGADGAVTAVVNGTATPVGELTLANFPNPPGLTPLGNNFYAASAASGNATTATPGQTGTGTLVQGFLEGSNVNPATELTNLLIAQATFAANSRAVVVENQMLTDTVSLIA